MITLFGNPISGNAHRVHTFLNLLGLDFEDRVLRPENGEHRAPDYLALNPLGQIPVLTDGDVVLRDSSAILVYLARKYDKSNKWLPEAPEKHAEVQQWLSVAVNNIMSGPALLRAIKIFNMPLDPETAESKTRSLFDSLFEQHLGKNDWLVGDSATLADIACYSYIARVTEGEFSLEPYPAIRAWLERVESIDGFAPMGHAADLLGG